MFSLNLLHLNINSNCVPPAGRSLSFTSISCTCSWLVVYICCRPCSSSLFLSRRDFPSSAASCRSEAETGWATVSALALIVQSHWWRRYCTCSSVGFSHCWRESSNTLSQICSTGMIHLHQLTDMYAKWHWRYFDKQLLRELDIKWKPNNN